MPTPQSILLKRECVPHFVNKTTRAYVLSSYRTLHRDLNQLPDSFIRAHLKKLAQDGFARFKYVSQAEKILALVDFAEANECKWVSGARSGNHKDISQLLRVAVSTYGVKNSSLQRVLFTPLPFKHSRKSLNFILNNVTIPRERNFEDHRKTFERIRKQKLDEIDHSYWKLIKLLQSNGIKTGKRDRKLLFNPEDTGTRTLTVLGQPLSMRRQENILKELYDRMLRDAPRPIHPKMYEHLKSQTKNISLGRKLRRRYSELVSECFTIDQEGKLVKD